jgi:peptide/nickel transport system ATP-binding protein
MNAIPKLGDARAALAQIDGAMPRLNAIPRGCAFNPRCDRSLERCREERPVLSAIDGSAARQAACWRYA